MSTYSFETIEYKKIPSVNAFVTSIENSVYHWHYQYEIFMVLKGSVRIKIDTEMYDLKKGDLMVINTRTIHEVRGKSGNLCGLIQIDPKLFQLDSSDKRIIRFFLNTAAEDEKTCAEEVRIHAAWILLCVLEDRKDVFYRLRSEVYSLIADLMEQADYDVVLKSGKSITVSEEMIAILDYFRDHLLEEKPVESAGRAFGISEKTLLRYFKAGLGISPKDFVNELRVEKAKRLLRETEKEISFIMDSCGFQSEKTFYRLFQGLTGQTPGNYRREVQGEGKVNQEIQDYLDFEPFEAAALLREILLKAGKEV